MDHTIDNGFDEERGGVYEQGYYFKNNAEIVDARKNWWAQAKGLNSLLLFSLLYPEEKQYRTKFLQQWEYVKKYVIDDTHGRWYPFGIDTEPDVKYSLKGQIWKASYHDGRALMHILKMLKGKGELIE